MGLDWMFLLFLAPIILVMWLGALGLAVCLFFIIRDGLR